MENGKQMPSSILESGPFAQSPAFEIRQGRLVIKFEPEIPYARVGRHEFSAAETPSVVVAGKKMTVSEIA